MNDNPKQSSEQIIFTTIDHTPLGIIGIAANHQGLTGLQIQPEPDCLVESFSIKGITAIRGNNVHLQLAAAELIKYFSGLSISFSVPIDWRIMPSFQRKVLQFTYAIPYGSTCTYSQIANKIGHPHAARAVGQAQARNPIPIIIPCHRVIGKDGKLHGYGAPGGLKTKSFLLQLEGVL